MTTLYMANKFYSSEATSEQIVEGVKTYNKQQPRGNVSVSLYENDLEVSLDEVNAKLPKYVKAKFTKTSDGTTSHNILSFTVNPTNGEINPAGWKRLNKFINVLNELKLIK